MKIMNRHQEAVIIGGGFYGASIAVYLAKQRGFKRITLIEQEDALLKRASFNNQARVHNGYHYPRNYLTAYRSRMNLPKFLRDWPDAIDQRFTMLYAISRRNSKVTAQQFQRFCQEIGVKIQVAEPALRTLFDTRMIEDVFQVEEYVFNARKLASWAKQELEESGVEIILNTKVKGISKESNGMLCVTAQSESGVETNIFSHYVFNCTYSGLNQLNGDFPGIHSSLKQEITELALVQVPPGLQNLGITVMDGPFFSLMPFPSRGLHTLSHVRYTPHLHWKDEKGVDPYQKLKQYNNETRVDRMLRDIVRYLPAAFDTQYIESLFEVKTLLDKHEVDDGRPIFFEKHAQLPGCFSVLGGKIDNIYDVLEKLEDESFCQVIQEQRPGAINA